MMRRDKQRGGDETKILAVPTAKEILIDSDSSFPASKPLTLLPLCEMIAILHLIFHVMLTLCWLRAGSQ